MELVGFFVFFKHLGPLEPLEIESEIMRFFSISVTKNDSGGALILRFFPHCNSPGSDVASWQDHARFLWVLYLMVAQKSSYEISCSACRPDSEHQDGSSFTLDV